MHIGNEKTPTLLTSKDGLIIEANEAFTSLSGYHSRAVTGQLLLDVIQFGDEALWEDISLGAFREGRLKISSGCTTTFLAAFVPILDHSLRPYQFRVTLSDYRQIPEVAAKLAAVEARIGESEKELRSFVSCVSHDLRSPLVSIKGFTTELKGLTDDLTEALDAGPALPQSTRELVVQYHEEMFEAINFIESSSMRVERLVNTLVEIYKLENTQLNDRRVCMTDLFRMIQASVQHQIDRKGCSVRMDPSFPSLWVDPTIVERIFANILDNAVKYLAPNRPGVISIRHACTDQELVYSVSDNGIGIPECGWDKVFMIFRRATDADVPGDGVGMAMVSALVKLYKGRIWFESEEGRGTTFHVAFPRTLAA